MRKVALMTILDSLMQMVVGLLIFILPYPIFLMGIAVYFLQSIHRLTIGILLVVFGIIGVCFWTSLLDSYSKTFGSYSSIILIDMSSSKLPLTIGVLSIVLGTFSIIRRKHYSGYSIPKAKDEQSN